MDSMKTRDSSFLFFVVFLVLATHPLLGRSILTTLDGSEILGDIEQEQFDFLSTDGEDLIMPRASLDRLSAMPDGNLEVTLKDGKSIVGTLVGEVTITDGLIKRRIQPEELREISFDVFVPLGREHEVVCPIRAAIEVPLDLVVGKLKTWRTSQTLLASCGGNRLNSLDFSREKNVLQTRVRTGEKPRKGTVLSVKPTVILADGEDQFVHLTFILMQGDRTLGKESYQFSGDEGELNNFQPVKVWIAPEDLSQDGAPLTLRFQMLTRERGNGKEPDTVFMWFVSIRI